MKQSSIDIIGSKALEVLGQTQQLQISGITSRGVFLRCNEDWMMFLTRERFRGPLTANLSTFDRFKDKFQMGADGSYDGGEIRFPDLEVNLDLTSAKVWRPDPLPEVTPATRLASARIAESLTEKLLRGELFSGIEQPPSSFRLEEVIRMTAQLIRDGGLEGLLPHLEPFLGLGQGLTPEGDDFVLGLVYLLRVANYPWLFTSEIEGFLTEITNLAKSRTTRLSANLIACAAEGLVDERISKVLSALHFDVAILDARIAELFTWGNTSGRMVLAGLLAGVLVGPEKS